MAIDPGSPLRILILGGGTAGWMAASLMAHRWVPRAVQITLLESPEVGIVGVGEGSTPQLKGFFDTLGIAEATWMPRCNATFKTAIRSIAWSTRPGFESYTHPFKTDLDDRSLPAYCFATLMRRRGFAVPAHPDPYFIDAALAARRLAPHPAHHFPFRAFYGYHFDAQAIGAFLREWATARGVTHRQGTVSRIEQNEHGSICAVHADGERRFEADFFIDCTGFRSLLLQGALGVPFVPFASNLFNDAAVALPTAHDQRPIAPQTTATALRYGWAWRIPLTSRVGNGYVYSTRYIEPEQAERELRAYLGVDDHIPARHLRMRVGRVALPWSHNCLAVGLAQGFIEPLEATALHLVQETIERFIDAFEAGHFGPARRDDFNREINARFEGVRDYIVCRYKANSRSDTPYWRDAQAIDSLSDALRAVLECWFRGGDLVAEVERLGIGLWFGAMSWHCLLGGYGLYPEPGTLRAPSAREWPFDLAKIEDFIARCCLNFPAHEQVLAEQSADWAPTE